ARPAALGSESQMYCTSLAEPPDPFLKQVAGNPGQPRHRKAIGIEHRVVEQGIVDLPLEIFAQEPRAPALAPDQLNPRLLRGNADGAQPLDAAFLRCDKAQVEAVRHRARNADAGSADD